MISHDQAQLLASERLDGPLSAADAEALATHLLTCADCRAFMNTVSPGSGPSTRTGNRRFLIRARYLVRAVSSWPM